MSDHPGSDQDSLSSWTLVTDQGLVESDSSSSSDFVKVDQQIVSYHKHRDDTDSDIDSLDIEDEGTEGCDVQNEITPASGSPEVNDSDENKQDDNESETETHDSIVSSEASQGAVSGPILAETDTLELVPNAACSEPVPQEVVRDLAPHATASLDLKTPPENASQALVTDLLPSERDSVGAGFELLFPIKDHAVEESEQARGNEEDEKHVAEFAEDILHRPHSSKEADAVIELLKVKLMTASEGSSRAHSSSCATDSDASDFVRIDPATAAVEDQQQQQMHTSSSSVASNFSFFNPRWWEAVERREVRHQDEEFEPLPGVDDRCESDISASEGSDVSAMDIVPVVNANTIRQYRHRPNNDLNSILNLVMLAVVTAAVGLGIGHSIGSARESYLQNQLRENQVERMKDLQDDLLGCWNKNEALDDHIAELTSDNSMMKEETELWKTKYRDTLVNIDDLQDQIRDLESARKQHEKRLREEKKTWRTEFKELTTDKLELQRQVQDADQTKQQLILLDEENQILKAEFKDLQKKLQTTVEEFDSFKQQSVSDAQQKAYLEKIATLQAKMQELETNQRTSQEEYELLEVRYESTLQELEYRQSIDRIKDQNLEDYQTEIGTLTTKLDTLEKNQKATKSEYASLMSKYQASNDETQHLKEAESQASSLLESYQSQITSLAEKLHDLEVKQKEKEDTTDTKFQYEVEPLKNRINILQTENEGLKMQLGRLRYTYHPANGESTTDPETVSNEEVQETTGDPLMENLRIKLDEIKAKQFAAKSRAAMWREFYIQEKQLREKLQQDVVHDGDNNNNNSTSNTAGLFTCISILMSHLRVNWSDPVVKNLTSAFGEKLYMLQNISSKSVQDAWAQIDSFTESQEFQEYVKAAKTTFEDAKDTLKQKFEELNLYVRSDEFSSLVNGTKDSINDFTESFKKKVSNIMDSVTLRTYVNKSKDTVASVTERLHSTWERLRNMSSQLVQNHQSTYNEVKTSVQDSMKRVADTVNKYWDGRRTRKEKEKNSREKDLKKKEKKKSHHVKHKESRPPRKLKGDNRKQDKYKKRKEHRVKLHENRKGHGRKLHKNGDHDKIHQPHCHGKHCRKMHQQKYRPRERKIQKHMEKIQGTIRKLNNKKMRQMGKDGAKDILKKLENLQEHFQEHHGAEKRSWLTCQLHWWKGYIRKKLNKETIAGCESILYKWQNQYNCKKGSCQNNNLSDYVVVLVNEEKAGSEASATLGAENPDMSLKKTITSSDKKDFADNSKEKLECNSTTWEGTDSRSDWYFQSRRKETDSDGKWYQNRMDFREDTRHSSEWWFNRGQAREYSRSPTNWLFERARYRENERRYPDHYLVYQDQTLKQEQDSRFFKPYCGMGSSWCEEKWEDDWDVWWG